jgi:hypothetical protein
MRYLGGVAIITHPESKLARALHHWELTPDSADPIALQAEYLMHIGLRRLILASNHPTARSLSKAERNFEGALPVMRTVIDTFYETQAARLTCFDPALSVLRPVPVTDETVYRHLCHGGRLEKLYTVRLLDGLLPAAYFGDQLERRTLVGLGRFSLTA